MRRMPTRAVFFDIDDTLYSTAAFAARARRRAMQAMVDLGGLEVTSDDLYAELREVITEFGSNDSRHYERLLRRFSDRDLGGHVHAVLVATGVRAYHDTKVEEFCADAQLVLVSHQKRTMEAADCLYGVSMKSGGSSRVVSERVAETVA